MAMIGTTTRMIAGGSLVLLAVMALGSVPVRAQALSYAAPSASEALDDQALSVAALGEEAQREPSRGRWQRAVVDYPTKEPAGTVIVDTGNTYLYYVLGQNRAIRYGVGVGREGFTWSGVQTIARKSAWPDWHPPAQMIARQPYLPRFVAGGPGNPLGARALYLGSSLYRIHGTNDPSTIGKFVSSGCIRLSNDDVIDLFNRVSVGTKVVVLPKSAAARRDLARTTTPASTIARQAMNLSAPSLYR